LFSLKNEVVGLLGLDPQETCLVHPCIESITAD